MSFPPSAVASRSKNGIFCGPFEADDSCGDKGPGNSGNSAPLGDSVNDTVNFDSSIGRTVACLHGLGGPSTVGRFVATIIVDSIYRVFGGRPCAHVGKKQGIVIPAVANRYSSSAITVKKRVRFSSAAISHRTPNDIFAGEAGRSRSNGTSMLDLRFRNHPSLFTSAAFYSPSNERMAMREGFVSADACAPPSNVMAGFCWRVFRNDGKMTERLSGQVDQSHGNLRLSIQRR